ncbi:hypothetical protein [Oceanobacillus salinisoli]|uniref:hypothetical protein n=1 Tax=Oceanobacillus salinisoli TaxID=2678611 RepID=UPI001E6256E7|nr:hypothetical protein [Oceanobacillus salinisoli]
MAFYGDFRVLDDWARDADRMTRGGNIQLEKVNILMRSASSQFLMKSAGKLFGTIPQKNKGIIHRKYKQFIESKDYSEFAKSITDRFMQQFEFFENSLERDIQMFFVNSYEVLNGMLKETEDEMEKNKDSLNEMRENPEIYRDPLTLFELKLRQFEWIGGEVDRIHEYR